MPRLFRHIIITILLWLILFYKAASQSPAINFQHLSVSNGLNDGIINAIVQDRYGYMWFASYGALNRFNGSGIKKYEHIMGDSTSAPGGIVHTLFCNSKGRLYAGGDNGLVEFDYTTDQFKRISGFQNSRITGMEELADGDLLVLADNKLYRYHSGETTKTLLSEKQQPGFLKNYQLFSLSRKNQMYYAGTYGGYIIYNSQTGLSEFKAVKSLSGEKADMVICDAKGNIWLNNIFTFRLVKVEQPTGAEISVKDLPAIAGKGVQQSFLDFIADNDNVWIVTSLTGLIQYNVHTGEIQFHQKTILKPGSIATNILRTIYRSGDGTIWVSLLGGVDYFHPQKNLFDFIFPFPSYDANQLARGFAEDKTGQYWFTTGDGVTRYNPLTRQYRIWRNEEGKAPAIYYNSARAVLAEGDDVWIATGKGINRYNLSTGIMQFLTAKDSLPPLFYLNINKDSKGTIWFCSNMSDGLFYLDPAEKKIHSIRNHPGLKKYTGFGVRRIFEDSKHRLWLGFSGKGYAMYDPASGQSQYWYHSKNGDSSFNSNLVIDIAEDQQGVIWLSTFDAVRGIDLAKNKYYWLSVKEGLPSNVTNGIRVDSLDRLWIGTSAGLAMVEKNRKSITVFDESYGFPGMEFPEHQAHQTRDGYFIFPTNKGYVRFNPAAYSSSNSQFPFYMAGFSVEGKSSTAFINFRNSNSLKLRPGENFFTIMLEGLNYANPGNTWYAYKLDGLEKDWHYTQDPRAVYTSVPGGKYIFRYKAASSPGNWSMEEKIFTITVGKYFYKTTGFYILLGLILILLLYTLYRYRLKQQGQVFTLQGKAQQLEKEKAQVMYESLKQQLNPHFLFNSLTSLSGLIDTDQRLAGDFLKQMSKIYRYILKSRDSETVKLKEEIEFVQTYISLQQTRFKTGLKVQILVSEEEGQKKIPPVTLQNLVENAIKHNIIDTDSPLIIEMFTDNGYLVIKNNLQRKRVVETSNKQGLSSLQSLYSYLSSKPVIIEEDAQEFRIKLPLI
jgi:ligand-binding sensor domain-containing protein